MGIELTERANVTRVLPGDNAATVIVGGVAAGWASEAEIAFLAYAPVEVGDHIEIADQSYTVSSVVENEEQRIATIEV